MKKLSKTKIVALSIIVLLLLVAAIFIISIPIISNLEHTRFTELDTSQRSIYDEIVKASDNAEKWDYTAGCTQIYTGPWPTGEYTCSTVISTSKETTSVDQLNALQTKYYPVVNNSDKLRQTSELDIQSPEDFGKKFVTSGVQRNYTDKSSGVDCIFRLILGQTKPSLDNSIEGSTIKDGIGITRISLSCENKSSEAWFNLIER
ncbi:MAG TPA: hypothetical protein PLZ58_01035 [Candidatus Saccharibacteria bacterium]|nr:hypothetical protein [Candidatus Saccharibacteria bacterium]HRQ07094.1 hypothetical protein [Candidatus Saccharibacteria bacterium]